MAFQPVNNAIMITVRHGGISQLNGSEAQWSVYTDLGIAATQSDVDGIADAMETWLSADYLPLLSEDWRVTGLNVKSLDEEGAPFAERTLDLAGTLTGDPPPAQCAVYFRFRGTGGGVPLAGGCFWPVGAESTMDGNTWLASWRTDVQAAMQSLIDDVLDGLAVGQTHIVVSRYASTNDDIKDARAALKAAIAASRRASGITNTVASFDLRPHIASQRDRRAVG